MSLNLGVRNPIGRQAGCDDGTWRNDYNFGTPAFHHEYQWLRNGQPILGATGATYVTTIDDLGTRLSCNVTASNPLGRSAPATGTWVLVPLPEGTQGATVLKAGGTNRYDPVNLLALSDDYYRAVREEVIPSLQRAVAAETKACAGRSDIPNVAPVLSTSDFPVSDVVRCEVLLHELEHVETTTFGVLYHRATYFGCGLAGNCGNLGFALASVDPATAPSIDPVLAERLRGMTPERVLWDIDGDHRTDAWCPGTAPVLRTILNPGHWAPHAVIVAPDSVTTDIYGMGSTAFDHGGKTGPTQLRPAQPFSCRTALTPPPNPNVGPCVTDGTIGRVHVTGNLCPINVRNLSDDDINALGDGLEDMLGAFSQAQETDADQHVHAQAAAFRSARAGIALSTAARTISASYFNTAASLADLDAGNRQLVSKTTIKQLGRVTHVHVAAVNFAADQIYVARGPIQINGVEVAPAGDAQAVLVPSDAKAADDRINSMILSARASTRRLSGIPLSPRQDLHATISDAVGAAATALPPVNLDGLLAQVGNISLGPFKLRGTATVKLENDGTATLTAKAIFPGFTDPTTGQDLRVDVSLHADRTGHISLDTVHLHAPLGFYGGVELKDVDLLYDGGISLKGQLLFPPLYSGLQIKDFRPGRTAPSRPLTSPTSPAPARASRLAAASSSRAWRADCRSGRPTSSPPARHCRWGRAPAAGAPPWAPTRPSR